MIITTNQMQTAWKRIKAWMKIHAPHLTKALRPKATQAGFARLEKAVGKRLPESFKNFYLVHNGQREGSEGLIDAEELLSTTRMLGEWRTWKELVDEGTFDGQYSEPDKGIKNNWFNPYWIPITYDGAGNHLCIDLDPAEGGKVSQVIRMWHDDTRRELIATSFTNFVKEYVKKLETGEYIYSAKWGGIVNKKKIEAWEEG